jgi:IS605 OrfB family transposase
MELTVVAKLDLSAQDKERLERTLDVFAAACNAISQVAFGQRCFNSIALHHMTYRDIRQRFNLHANYTVRARERVANAYKILKANKQPLKLLKFKARSLDLDARLFRLFWKGDEAWVSIAACDGKRIKCHIKVGQRYLPILRASNPTFAVLKRHRDGEIYLYITVSVPEPKPSNLPQSFVGVDLGEIDLLVASNGVKISGVESIERRKRFRARRSILQRKGTRAKKARIRLGNKERRWAQTYLHTVSRRFVDSLSPNSLVVLEDLTGIRDRCKRKGAEQRAQFHTWAFRQLQFMIAYKARLAGHQVVFVKPNYTSRTCPRCGHVCASNRLSTRLFRCQQCGFQHNANFVAALNIATRAVQAGLGGAGLPSTSLKLRGLDLLSKLSVSADGS